MAQGKLKGPWLSTLDQGPLGHSSPTLASSNFAWLRLWLDLGIQKNKPHEGRLQNLQRKAGFPAFRLSFVTGSLWVVDLRKLTCSHLLPVNLHSTNLGSGDMSVVKFIQSTSLTGSRPQKKVWSSYQLFGRFFSLHLGKSQGFWFSVWPFRFWNHSFHVGPRVVLTKIRTGKLRIWEVSWDR